MSVCADSLFEHNLHFMFQLLHTCVGDMAQEERGQELPACRKCWVPRTYINLGVAIYACPASWWGRRHSWQLANQAQWDELENDRGGHLLFSGLWKYLHSCAPMYTNNHITENMLQALCLQYFRTFFLLGKYHAPTQTHFL